MSNEELAAGDEVAMMVGLDLNLEEPAARNLLKIISSIEFVDQRGNVCVAGIQFVVHRGIHPAALDKAVEQAGKAAVARYRERRAEGGS